ncbi:uncharacterized protein LOC135167494 isoform X2 [Diachasmimorpha longicaudata]|uniref:uncharacterized protein LOC135167494 isoform X2 n=1 Tax=Diachasmimorpha longicaudata TaxID=58733 RepID=UPI0030B883CA
MRRITRHSRICNESCLRQLNKTLITMLRSKLRIFIWILLAVLTDIISCQYTAENSWGSASQQAFGGSKDRQPIVFTTTPGDLCREYLGSELAIWASYAYRADICTRPISCRIRPSFVTETRPGPPPEGMLCALHLRGDGQEAVKFVCHRGNCVREQPNK